MLSAESQTPLGYAPDRPQCVPCTARGDDEVAFEHVDVPGLPPC